MIASSTGVPFPQPLITPLPGSLFAGFTDPDEPIGLTIRVRPRSDPGRLSAHVVALAVEPPAGRQHMGREDFAATHGARDEDVDAVLGFAESAGLKVEAIHPGSRTIKVTGLAAEVAAAFGISLVDYDHPIEGPYRVRNGRVFVPAHLGDVIESIIGFDTRPYARSRLVSGRVLGSTPGATPSAVVGGPGTVVHAHTAGFAGQTGAEVAAYHNAVRGDGAGQVIAILTLGGGFRQSEVDEFRRAYGLPDGPPILFVGVNGATNDPGTGPPAAFGPDGEVMLDLLILTAACPAAQLVLIKANNTGRGFVDALSAAVHGLFEVAPGIKKGASITSCSWGSPEDGDDPAQRAMESELQAAAAIGMTFPVASGDNGSDDALDGLQRVDYPAASIWALAVGGTTMTISAGKVATETAWPGSGGGQSPVHRRPEWQVGPGLPPGSGRCVPDVASVADPATGYIVWVDGQRLVSGGTSAAAPQVAGEIARENARRGKPVGFMNPILYRPENAGMFFDVVDGSNGAYKATPGYDATTGLGVIDWSKAVAALGGGPGAGATTGIIDPVDPTPVSPTLPASPTP